MSIFDDRVILLEQTRDKVWLLTTNRQAMSSIHWIISFQRNIFFFRVAWYFKMLARGWRVAVHWTEPHVQVNPHTILPFRKRPPPDPRLTRPALSSPSLCSYSQFSANLPHLVFLQPDSMFLYFTWTQAREVMFHPATLCLCIDGGTAVCPSRHGHGFHIRIHMSLAGRGGLFGLIFQVIRPLAWVKLCVCLLYTSDAADE